MAESGEHMKFKKEDKWYTRMAVLRAYTGKKQAKICDENGFDKKAYSNWERGLRMPEPQNKARIADALGATVEEIWG